MGASINSLIKNILVENKILNNEKLFEDDDNLEKSDEDNIEDIDELIKKKIFDKTKEPDEDDLEDTDEIIKKKIFNKDDEDLEDEDEDLEDEDLEDTDEILKKKIFSKDADDLDEDESLDNNESPDNYIQTINIRKPIGDNGFLKMAVFRKVNSFPPVGRHKEESIDDFDFDQLKKGIKIEKEHTPNPLIAMQIAKDHLAEIPDYYDRLERMEREALK